jgi:oxygen-dependent protoporphyrinogen oxidase
MRQAPPADGRRTSSLFMAPRSGMAEIVEAIAARVPQVTVRLGVPVQRVVQHPGDDKASPTYEVLLEHGPTLPADAIVFATPSYVTARLVENFHPKLAKALQGIPYVSTATVSLAFQRADVAHPLDGFGFLVGRHERCDIIGATWTSTKFPHRAPAEHALIRCFIGGAGREHLVSRDDAALVQLVREALRAILGITAPPLLTRVFRWEKANPQYLVGHLERVAAMEQMLTPHPGLFLTGSAYHGIGVPDCILQGTQTAERLLAMWAVGR